MWEGGREGGKRGKWSIVFGGREGGLGAVECEREGGEEGREGKESWRRGRSEGWGWEGREGGQV